MNIMSIGDGDDVRLGQDMNNIKKRSLSVTVKWFIGSMDGSDDNADIRDLKLQLVWIMVMIMKMKLYW